MHTVSQYDVNPMTGLARAQLHRGTSIEQLFPLGRQPMTGLTRAQVVNP